MNFPPPRWIVWPVSVATGVAVGWRIPSMTGGGQATPAPAIATEAAATDRSAAPSAAEAAKAVAPAKPASAILSEWDDLVTRAGGLTPATMPALYVAVNSIRDSWRRRALRAALVEEWIVQDAAGAFRQAAATAGAAERFLQVPEVWMARDPEATVNAILKQPETMEEGLATALLPQLIEARPDLVARFANALLPSPPVEVGINALDALLSPSRRGPFESKEPTVAAFAALAGKDPERLRTLLDELKGPTRDWALLGLARSYAAAANPQEGLKWAESLESPGAQAAARREILGAWAQLDPKAAATFLADQAPHENVQGAAVDSPPSFGDPFVFSGRNLVLSETTVDSPLEMAVNQMARQDLAATIDWLEERVGQGIPDTLMTGPALALAATDPAAAVALLGRIESADARKRALDALAGGGGRGPEEWHTWIESQPASPVHDELRRSIAAAWMESDPGAARQWIDSTPEGPLKDQLRGAVMVELTERRGAGGLDEALAYLEAAPSASRSTLVASFFAAALEQADPARVAPLLDHLTDAEEKQKFTHEIAEHWTKLDPPSAVTWAESLTDPAAREAALISAADVWPTTDPHEASEWAARLEPGSLRDRAAVTLAMSVADDAPADALAWTESIGDAELRQHAATRLVWGLRAENPSLAEQLLNQSNLSDADVAAVIHSIQEADDSIRRGSR